jgi:glycosyltransferase involved in cell wall biosynthesis
MRDTAAASGTPQRKHRILLASDGYPPVIGGADRAVASLARALLAGGHAVAVVTPWQAGVPSREQHDGIPVHRVRDLTSRVRALSANPYKHGMPPWPDPEASWRIRRLIRSFKPDILHSYGWITYSCALALWRTGIPLVVSMRDYGNVCAVRTLVRNGRDICSGPGVAKCLGCATDFYGPVKGPVAVAGVLGGRRALRRRLAGLHYNSSYMRDVMHRDLLDVQPARAENPQEAVVPTFRDDAKDAPPDPELLARLPHDPFILFVGALRRVKGVQLLLDAYERLLDPRSPLVLIGTREIDTPSTFPPGVVVHESWPHGTVMAAWERAMFGVFPSIWPEPFGNVVHEAMSRGCPVIGTTPGGHRDMISHERTGLLVQAGDREELLAAMRRLIEDSALRTRLGREARSAAQQFTADTAMPAFLELYGKVLPAC